MTTAIAIEDVRREVKILRALNGHNNLIQFYDAFEEETGIPNLLHYNVDIILVFKCIIDRKSVV